MVNPSKNLIPRLSPDVTVILVGKRTSDVQRLGAGDLVRLIQVGLVFGLILVAVWTSQGQFNSTVSIAAAFCVLWFTCRGKHSARDLGLAQPAAGVLIVGVTGLLILSAIVVFSPLLKSYGLPHPVPYHRAWQYAIWALLQEFILQSFFFVWLESVFGSRRAVFGSALLFSLAHLPGPVLTLLSFVGGLFFCEMFRRYRNILPLGGIHAALGLTIAATLPDSLLHHMRVGIGYLQYRP